MQRKGKNQGLLFPGVVIPAPACPSAALILSQRDPTAPKLQLWGQEGKGTSSLSLLPPLYRVQFVLGAANAPAASWAEHADILRPLQAASIVSSILQCNTERKPISGRAQASTHIHRRMPVPPALSVPVTFFLPSCSKQLMRKP